MLKIKLSYEDDSQANEVLRLLKPVIRSCKVKRAKDGKYKKLYIEIKNSKV